MKKKVKGRAKDALEVKEKLPVDKNQLEDKDFDFGGLPKNVPFKRNLGCGG